MPTSSNKDRQRVVVSGAFGYVGLAFLERHKRDLALIGVGHAPRCDYEPTGVEAHIGDTALAAEVAGSGDSVVHLAGGGGAAFFQDNPVAGVRNTVRSTAALLEGFQAKGVGRKVFASTIAVYGTFRDHGRPYDEATSPEPDDLYGALKEATEAVWSLCGGTSLRLANIYGAGSGYDVGLMGVVERFARAAATGAELSIYGDGAQRIDFVHVDDVADAFALALSAEAPPRVINVGGGAPVSIRELAEIAIRAGQALGQSPTLISKTPPPGKVWPDRSLDITRAHESLGWTPRVTIEHGMTELVQMMHRTGADQ